ncbi:creatininase family protein [Pseudooceanicola spongiae]|uniref:Creatininase family protein n=1 Tax=Pseudooceanicola spongiae TaxID=2613965 RepID=A0A7L9WQ30_9RHOB|nr:creatininase family protein [Pseudooceanicola spongiae]QOL82485.1 creatininase family protein [Pseudooceanicola spongiae]
MPFTHWSSLKTTDFAAMDARAAVALLPVGATEQHGPHLPLSTDSVLGEGVALAAGPLVTRADVYLLPTITYAKSDEHLSYPGTLTLSSETLLATLVEIGRSVARAGIRRLVLLNAHGGNVPVLQIAARRLRLEEDMLCVTAGWMAMGFPPGLVSEQERAEGIHGGFVETSAMLHLAPALVDMTAAQDFTPASASVAAENDILRMLGPVGFGWVSEDLHPAGVAGNAAAATPEAGRALIDHAATRYATLLDEVAAQSLPERRTGARRV